jgi:hypothetical protein
MAQNLLPALGSALLCLEQRVTQTGLEPMSSDDQVAETKRNW